MNLLGVIQPWTVGTENSARFSQAYSDEWNERGTRMFSASIAQRRLWFIHRYGEKPSAVATAVGLRMTGGLDTDVLETALRDLVARHEALRTLFPEGPDGLPRPRPVAAERAVLSLPVVDVTEPEVTSALIAAARQSFDLACELPLRAALLRSGTASCTLILTAHHIAVDEPSLNRLLGELCSAYDARLQGRVPQWEDAAFDRTRHVAAERTFLADSARPGTEAARQLAHWRTELAGLRAPMSLPHGPAAAAQAQRTGRRRCPFRWKPISSGI